MCQGRTLIWTEMTKDSVFRSLRILQITDLDLAWKVDLIRFRYKYDANPNPHPDNELWMVIQATWEQQRWAPHCHVRKEPLPRARHHTATSERNPCHAQETTLLRQKQTPPTHKTLHCHMVDELLPRARHQTATRETNTCHTRPRLCKWKKQKKTKRETNKQQKKH